MKIVACVCSTLFYLLSTCARTSEATDDVYSVYFDGENAIPTHRVNITGKVAEFLIRYEKASTMGIRLHNATHAFIPMRTHLRGQFARKLHITKESEVGVVNEVWVETVASLVGKDTLATTNSKWLVVDYNGPWDGTTHAIAKEQTPEVAAAAKAAAPQRILMGLAQIFASGYAKSVLKSGSDAYVLGAMFAYAYDESVDHYDAHKADIDVLRISITDADLAARAPTNLDVLKVEKVCHHIEKREGSGFQLAVDEDTDGMYVPLKTALVAHTGHTGNAPVANAGVRTGQTMVMFDEETDVLEIYNYAASGNFLTPPSAYADIVGLPKDDILISNDSPYQTNAFYVGTPDGKDDALPLPAAYGRILPEEGPSAKAFGLYSEMMGIPVDYTYLSQDPLTICNANTYADADAALALLDSDRVLDVDMSDNEKATILSSSIVPAYSQAFPCTIQYHRGVYVVDSIENSATIWNNFAYIHGLLEIPSDVRMFVMSAYDGEMNSISLSQETKTTTSPTLEPTFKRGDSPVVFQPGDINQPVFESPVAPPPISMAVRIDGLWIATLVAIVLATVL